MKFTLSPETLYNELHLKHILKLYRAWPRTKKELTMDTITSVETSVWHLPWVHAAEIRNLCMAVFEVGKCGHADVGKVIETFLQERFE